MQESSVVQLSGQIDPRCQSFILTDECIQALLKPEIYCTGS